MTAPNRACRHCCAAVVLLSLLLGGCADKAAEAAADDRRVAGISSSDASAAVRDSELGFALTRPGPGWKLLHANDAAALVPGAVAGAISAGGVNGVVRVSKMVGTPAAHAKASMAGLQLEDRQLQPGRPLALEGGEAVQVLANGTRAGIPLRFGLVVVAQGARAWELWAWAAESTSAADGASFLPFYQAFHADEGAETSKLPAPPEATIPRGKVASGHALRGGVYRDFDWGVVVTLPTAGWRVRAGEAARAVDEAARLHLVKVGAKGGEPDGSSPAIEALLFLAEAGKRDGPGYHDEARKRLVARSAVALSPAVDAKLAGLEAQHSRGSAAGVQYALWSLVDEGLALQWLAWGPGLGDESRDQLASFVELRRGSRAVEMTTNSYRDNRLGFELRPPLGWQHRDITPEALVARGSAARWEDNGRWLAVVAADVEREGDAGAWIASFLEQLLRQQLGPLARGPAQRSELEFAGHPAVRLSWSAPLEHVDALIVRRGTLVYAILTVDHAGDSFQAATLDFKLLP